jgi:dihydroflavonol-4-reductase
MTTLITGASGFVGSAVLRTLLAAGHSVRVIVRPQSNPRNLRGLDVDIHTGDLLDPEARRAALRSCRYLFHVAADYRLWAPDPGIIYRNNVDATRELCTDALAAGIERIVYTSSVATLGITRDGTPADENTHASLADLHGPYKRSKYLAELAVLELIKTRNLPAIIVNPSTPVGPRDVRPTPTGRIILDTLRGRMPAYVDTGLNIAHVDDIATGHLLAFEQGAIGERYILGGDNLTLKQILDIITAYAGLRPVRHRLPYAVALAYAGISELLARLAGTEPRATLAAVRMARYPMYFSSAKAERELGYRYRPAADALRDAIDWFRANGYVQ